MDRFCISLDNDEEHSEMKNTSVINQTTAQSKCEKEVNRHSDRV